jgi:hypothetical protein
MKTSTIHLIFVALLVGCQINKTDSNRQDVLLKPERKIDTIERDTAKIVELDFDATYLKRKGRSDASLTTEEYHKLDSLIENRLEVHNILEEARYIKLLSAHPNDKFEKGDFIINLSQYGRQYVAYYNKKGEKEVWINCFCAVINDEWKKAILIGSDGGNCFFNLTINLSTEKITEFSVNGNA